MGLEALLAHRATNPRAIGAFLNFSGSVDGCHARIDARHSSRVLNNGKV